MANETNTVEQTNEQNVEQIVEQNNEQTNEQAEQNAPALKYTDEDVNRIVAKKIAKEREKAKAEADEAARLAAMTEQERTAAELEKALQEVAELKAAKERAEMTSTARKMLSEQGVNVPENLVGVLVKEDADTTKEAVESFAAMFKNAVDAEVKAKLGGSTPKTGSVKTLTADEILAVPNREERQKLIADNLELFK